MDDRAVRHAGRETAYRLGNPGADGEPIVFVHGAGADGRIWRQLAATDLGRPVVVLELSGHGKSEDFRAEPGGETLTAYATDLEAVREEVGGGILVGHDLGGAVILEYLSWGHDVLGAICVGVGPRMPVNETMRRLARDDLPGLIDFLHRPGHLFVDPAIDPAELTRTMLSETGQSVVGRDYETCHRLDLGGVLADITVPVRVVAGTRDRITPPESNRKLADRLPNGSLAIVAEAAHVPMMERPDAVEEVIRTFLGEI